MSFICLSYVAYPVVIGDDGSGGDGNRDGGGRGVGSSEHCVGSSVDGRSGCVGSGA